MSAPTSGLHLDVTLTRNGQPLNTINIETAAAIFSALAAAFPGVAAANPTTPGAIIGVHLTPGQESAAHELNAALSDIEPTYRDVLRATLALPPGWVAVRADDLDLAAPADQARLAGRARATLGDVTAIRAATDETTWADTTGE